MKKRIVSLLLCLALALTLLPAAVLAAGITWKFDEATATLTVSGAGPMENYELRSDHYAMTTAPWTEHYRQVKTLVVEPGITTVGDCAFANFEALENVTLPEGITYLGGKSFYNCKKLKACVIPQTVTTIESMAFYGCNSMETVVLPKDLVSLSMGCFQHCYALKELDLPAGLLNFNASALQGCKGLTKLTIPASVRALSSAAISGCEGLEELVFQQNLKSIGSSTLSGCKSLKAVYLPVALESVDKNAFRDSAALTDIYYAGTEEQWKKVEIQTEGNDSFLAAKVHYNTAPTPAFTDVADSAWYSATVTAAAKAGIIAGNADGSFDPNGTLSWAHAITFAVRLDQYCKGQKVYSAADQTGSKWYDIYLQYALQNKILTAEPQNMTAAITRGEAAVIFAAVPVQFKQVNTVAEGYFTDVSASSAMHDAVYALACAGICNGTGSGTFGVANTFKRCEVAAIVARMAGLVAPAVIG